MLEEGARAAAFRGSDTARPRRCFSIQGEAGGRQSRESSRAATTLVASSVLKNLGSGVGRPPLWQPPRSTQGSVICPESRILTVSTVPDTEPLSVPEAPWNTPILAVPRT
jgi:hypothetical protein